MLCRSLVAAATIAGVMVARVVGWCPKKLCAVFSGREYFDGLGRENFTLSKIVLGTSINDRLSVSDR